MSTAMTDVRLVTHPPARSHGGQYVHPGMPQQVYFQMASNSFQASGESVRQENISNSSINAPTAIPKGIYLHESQSRYYASNAAEKTLKRLDHLNPVQLQEGEYPKPPTAKFKEYYLKSQQIRQETSTAVTNLHNEPSNGIQKIVRVANVPECPDRFPAINVRISTTQYESAQQIQAERCHGHQNGHHLANVSESSSEKRMIYLQPSGYQTQLPSIPMTTGNPVHLALSGIQSSNTTHMGPRYPVNFQNPRGQASTPVAPGGIHSTIPAKSSINPYYPDDNNPLSREYQQDPNLTKCHVSCETPKYISAALPAHPMKAVPTDAHSVTHPPTRQLPVYTQEEPIKNRSQEAHFPVRIVYVPSNGATCVTSPRPYHTDNPNGPNGPPCPAEVYNTREARQPVSISASQPFKTNGGVQYTTCYANAPHSCVQVKSMIQKV
ncbi:hypothetical protein ACROYT_G042546 [Oculina patagonica]